MTLEHFLKKCWQGEAHGRGEGTCTEKALPTPLSQQVKNLYGHVNWFHLYFPVYGGLSKAHYFKIYLNKSKWALPINKQKITWFPSIGILIRKVCLLFSFPAHSPHYDLLIPLWCIVPLELETASSDLAAVVSCVFVARCLVKNKTKYKASAH